MLGVLKAEMAGCGGDKWEEGRGSSAETSNCTWVPAEVVIMTDCLSVQGEQRWGQIVGLKSQVK